MADRQLDAAVQDFAERFRAALDPPAQAGVTIDRAELAARFDEPLPEHGMPVDAILGRPRGALCGRPRGRHRRALLRVRHGRLAAGRGDRRGLDGSGRPEPRHVAARAGRRRARAGDDPLARRSARFPGRVGLLRIGRHDGEHRRARGRAPPLRPQARRGHHRAGRPRPARVRRLRSEELHLSDHKALRTLGLGSGCVRTIPIDDRYAMRVDLLAEAIERDRARASSRRS